MIVPGTFLVMIAGAAAMALMTGAPFPAVDSAAIPVATLPLPSVTVIVALPVAPWPAGAATVTVSVEPPPWTSQPALTLQA